MINVCFLLQDSNMQSEPLLIDKGMVARVYLTLNKTTDLDYISFIRSIGLDVDRNFFYDYVVVNERKWFLNKIKYGI